MKVKYVIFFQYTLLGKKKSHFLISASKCWNAFLHLSWKGQIVPSLEAHSKFNFFQILLLLGVNVAETTKHHYSLCQLTFQVHPWSLKQKEAAQGKIWWDRIVWVLQSFSSFPWTSGQACLCEEMHCQN